MTTIMQEVASDAIDHATAPVNLLVARAALFAILTEARSKLRMHPCQPPRGELLKTLEVIELLAKDAL